MARNADGTASKTPAMPTTMLAWLPIPFLFEGLVGSNVGWPVGVSVGRSRRIHAIHATYSTKIRLGTGKKLKRDKLSPAIELFIKHEM